MAVVEMRDAVTKMDSLLDAVSRGESFTIVRGGVAMAKMVPVGKVRRTRRTLPT